LDILRKNNPNVVIYGLYGGEHKDAEKFKKHIGKYLDDFYISPFKNSEWKWFNGDLMIVDWYKKRGRNLEWDTIILVQWDMLIFDSISNLFKNLKKDEILLSGLRKVKGLEKKWCWVKKDGKWRKDYLKFLGFIKKEYGFRGTPLASLFIVVAFPRKFLDKYSKIKKPELGFLEYKVPIYAKIFGIKFSKNSFYPNWFDKNVERTLNALTKEIDKRWIIKNLKAKKGKRLFHPYYKIWKK